MENAIDQLIAWSKDLNVLYVEDDLALREEVSLFLSDIFQKVDLAANGEEGLRKLAQNNYNLVITDIRMPVMDGIEMIEKIKEIYPEQAVLVTSAHNEVEYLVKLINLGVDNFVTKPLQSEQIFKVLHKIVEHIHHKKELRKYQQDLQDANAKLRQFTSMQSRSLDLKSSILKSYKEAIDKATIVVISDKFGVITDVNDNFCKATGFSKEEVIGQTHKIIEHPSTDKKTFSDIWKTIQEKQAWQGLIINQTRNLTPLYHYTTIVPILDAKGEIFEFIAIIQDLTELYRLNEEATKASLNIAKSLKEDEFLKQIPFAAATLSYDLIFEEYNKRFEELANNHADDDTLVKLTKKALTLKDLVTFIDMDQCNTLDDLKDRFAYEGDIAIKGNVPSIGHIIEVSAKITAYNNHYLICFIMQEEFELCCQVHES
jgi:PAS domain S-box-containing protein